MLPQLRLSQRASAGFLRLSGVRGKRTTYSHQFLPHTTARWSVPARSRIDPVIISREIDTTQHLAPSLFMVLLSIYLLSVCRGGTTSDFLPGGETRVEKAIEGRHLNFHGSSNQVDKMKTFSGRTQVKQTIQQRKTISHFYWPLNLLQYETTGWAGESAAEPGLQMHHDPVKHM